MVRVLIYCGGYPEYLCMTYVRGEIYDQGEIDEDLISITHWGKKLHSLGYRNHSGFWCKLDEEWSDNGLYHIRNDSDVIELIGMIQTKNTRVLHLYVDHETDVADLIDPTEQPTDIERGVGEDGVIEDANVERGVGGKGGVEDANVEEGVGEDSSDDPDYEVSGDENLSEYETTDAEDEDLYTNVRRGKNMEDTHNNFDWFGVGATSNAPNVDVISTDSDDSERDMDSLSSESDDANASRSGRKKIRYPDFTENDLKGKIKLKKGIRFPNTKLLKTALKTFAIQNGFDFVYQHNDKIRVTAVCKLKCGWRLHASQSNKRDAIQIKTFVNTHNCGTHHENKKANMHWIANQYLEEFRDDPTWTVYALRERVKRDYNINIPKWVAYRAKTIAMKKIYGSEVEHYQNSRDYAAAVHKWNPGSMCGLLKDDIHFHRMFVCFDACKKGMIAGCRPMIALDGCHLKGPYGGQLLCAVGRDGNDDMYPIAYAVVESECRESWTWFMASLLDCLGPIEERGWVFMSDRQKVIYLNHFLKTHDFEKDIMLM